MSTRSLSLILSAAGLLLACLPAGAKSHNAKPAKPIIRTAVITNSGSTNTTGYEIVISSNGAVRYDGRSCHVPVSTAAHLFHDLDAAGPLPDLKVKHGVQSVSFGTHTYITYKHQRSPDLTFGGDAHAMALKADIDAIIKLLHATNTPRHRTAIRQLRSNGIRERGP